jgi:hypothetical protein
MDKMQLVLTMLYAESYIYTEMIGRGRSKNEKQVKR